LYQSLYFVNLLILATRSTQNDELIRISSFSGLTSPVHTPNPNNSRPILQNKLLTHDHYLELAKIVNTARLKTKASHEKNSGLGGLGITHSRLEKSLNAYLAELVSRNKITSEELNTIINPVITNKDSEIKFG